MTNLRGGAWGALDVRLWASAAKRGTRILQNHQKWPEAVAHGELCMFDVQCWSTEVPCASVLENHLGLHVP